VQRSNSESEKKGSNILFVIGILAAVFGVVMLFYLDKIMFGYVTFLGPILIALGIVFILVNLAVMIDSSRAKTGSSRNTLPKDTR
jgi:uncharacterized membrane protein HdeD (DUF308 family)